MLTELAEPFSYCFLILFKLKKYEIMNAIIHYIFLTAFLVLPLILLLYRVKYKRYAPWWAIFLIDVFVGWFLFLCHVIFEDKHKMDQFHAYEGMPPAELIYDALGKGEAVGALCFGGVIPVIYFLPFLMVYAAIKRFSKRLSDENRPHDNEV